MMTDLVRFPDWRADLCALAPGVGVILRDYSHRDRAAIAGAMAQLCKAQSRVFLVAGDAQLAAQVKAGFHCPSHLLTRQPPQAMSGLRPATAAVHNRREIFQAAKSGYRAVLLSPAFPTTSHPDARAWGPVRFLGLAREAASIGLRVYALGGINAANWRRLSRGQDVVSGFAAISHFHRQQGPDGG
jgi:thiamine-phosphate pyrophosphorylase